MAQGLSALDGLSEDTALTPSTNMSACKRPHVRSHFSNIKKVCVVHMHIQVGHA